MDDFSGFTQGVEIGGLRDSLQIKLLIEYIIENIKEPVSVDNIVNSLVSNGIANYFEAAQAAEELIENGSISKSETGFLNILPKGSTSLRTLVGELPVTVKEEALKSIADELIKVKNESLNSVKIIPCQNGFNVICKVMHKNTVLMQLDIYAADFDRAEIIKSNFMKNPAKVYSSVISSLEEAE